MYRGNAFTFYYTHRQKTVNAELFVSVRIFSIIEGVLLLVYSTCFLHREHFYVENLRRMLVHLPGLAYDIVILVRIAEKLIGFEYLGAL